MATIRGRINRRDGDPDQISMRFVADSPVASPNFRPALFMSLTSPRFTSGGAGREAPLPPPLLYTFFSPHAPLPHGRDRAVLLARQAGGVLIYNGF